MSLGLLCISLLDTMAWKVAIGIGAPGSLHRCRATTKVLENRPLTGLILDIAALEYGAAFVLATWVIHRKLRILLNDDSED